MKIPEPFRKHDTMQGPIFSFFMSTFFWKENQTLPEEKLNLSTEEKKAIIAFLHSLTNKKIYKP